MAKAATGIHLLGIVALGLALSACGRKRQAPHHLPEVGVSDPQDPMGVVIKSRAYFDVSTSNDSIFAKLSLIPKAFAASGSQGVTLVNAAATQFALDNSEFVVPAASDAVLDFGYLAVSKLKDNNLRVCGDKGKDKCTKAFLRIYTTGVPGSGLWNAADEYGAPMSAQLTGSEAKTIGLDPAGSVSMQVISIPSNKRVVKLADFSPTPRYNIQSDFSDAGAGDYSTTIVVEYGLSL